MHSSTWASMLLELPLELAAFGSRTNPYWLRKRKRSRWWSKGHYPRVRITGKGGCCDVIWSVAQ